MDSTRKKGHRPEKRDISGGKRDSWDNSKNAGKPLSMRVCGVSSRARAKKQEKTIKKPAKNPATETRSVDNANAAGVPCTGHPCGVPPPLRGGSPSRKSWPPEGARQNPRLRGRCPLARFACLPHVRHVAGVQGTAYGLKPPHPTTGTSAATVQRQGFALRACILTRSMLRASPLRFAAASGAALDPAPTLKPLQTALGAAL